MKKIIKGMVWLVLGFLVTGVLVLLFILPEVSRSGKTYPGVCIPYYVILFLLPFSAFRATQYIQRASVYVVYGILTGALFSVPVFFTRRGFSMVTHSHGHYATLHINAVMFTSVVTFACVMAWWFKKRSIQGAPQNKGLQATR